MRTCSTVKCGCKASLRVAFKTRKQMIKSFEDGYNHKFVASSKRMKMKLNRNLPKATKRLG